MLSKDYEGFVKAKDLLLQPTSQRTCSTLGERLDLSSEPSLVYKKDIKK